jgi:drug/metabolite transporter (DMT)-like permease
MDEVTAAWWGLILAILGALGVSIRAARNRHIWRNAAERRIVWRSLIWLWLIGALFAVLMLTLPFPESQLLWIPLPLLLGWSVLRFNTQLARARAEEPD